MEVSTLREVLAAEIAQAGRPPSIIFITSYSLNPTALIDIFVGPEDKPDDNGLNLEPGETKVYCFFQRYSFKDMGGDRNQYNRIVGAEREAILEFFDKDLEKRFPFTRFRIRTRRPARHQFHLKVAILLFPATRNVPFEQIKVVQFSRNIDLQNEPQDQIVYSGLPQQLDTLLKLLKAALERERVGAGDGERDRARRVGDALGGGNWGKMSVV